VGAVALLLIQPAAGQTPTESSGQVPAAPAADTAEQDPAGQPPTFRTGINFVRVDVIVTDRQGNPVTDLTAADFEILEEGTPQTVETFRLIEVGGGPRAVTNHRAIHTRSDEETAAADEDARIFVFFLDDYHVRLGSSLGARKQLVDFVENNLGPTDLVAVMYPLSPLDTVTLTRDHDSIVRMLERFEGRKYDYEPRNQMEARYAHYPSEVVERIRREVSLSALEGLSVKLGSLREGRKAVLVVSEGFPAVLPPQMRDQSAAMPGIGNPNRGDPFAGENSLLEDRASFAGEADLLSDMQHVVAAANRNNTAFYTIDPRGLATGEFELSENVGMRRSQEQLGKTQDTLRLLASETDGRAIVNRNDLVAGMRQILRDSSAYYLLGYTSSRAPMDGAFHEIRVGVRRSGTQVRARKGYWALTMEDTKRAEAPPPAGPPPDVTRALALIAEPTGARFVRTWVGLQPGSHGHTAVTVVWEPIPPAPGSRREAASSVSVIAASPEGELVYRGRAESGAETGGAVAPTGRGGASVRFEAPPGPLQLRLSIEGEGGTLDTDNRQVVVPDLTGPELKLDTPRVHVARNALEYQQLAKTPEAPPVATRDFRRTERLIVRVGAFGPGGTDPQVTSRLLSRLGQPMTDVAVTAPVAAGAPYLIDLPLSSLAPGAYLLELAAAASGLNPVRELVAFTVVN